MKKLRFRYGKPSLTTVRIHCADQATPFYPQKLALTSPTSGGRSVVVVRLRTKGHGVCLFGSSEEFVSWLMCLYLYLNLC
jgi:hypothetical protein